MDAIHFIYFLNIINYMTVVGKENILIIISDDLRPSFGCYGDRTAYTPNIDALGQESATFLNTYAQQALCAPSRNSFLTSRRPDTLRLFDFYSYWRDTVGNFTTLPQFFKEHGYQTKSIGKVFHPGISSNFSDDQPYSWTEAPYHPPTEQYKDAPVCGLSGSLQRDLVCPVAPSLQPGGTLPDLQSLAHARSFLRERSKISQPFLLAVGFHKPHVPLKFPYEFLDFHPLENVTLPADLWPTQIPPVAWNPWTDIRSRHDIDRLNISFPFGQIPDDWSRLIRQSYYAAVSYMDSLVGELLRELRATNLYHNTIVVLLGDHGWSLGEHGEWSKFSNYEVAVRVPLLIRIPGLTDRQAPVVRSSEAIVELLDLFPTLVDAVGLPSLLPCPKNSTSIALCTEGTSLVPVMYKSMVYNETIADIGKPALSQYPRPGMYPTAHPNSDKPRLDEIRYMGYSMRTRRFRYTEWPAWHISTGPQWNVLAGAELYDHGVDPREDLNLADRPQLQELREMLSRELQRRVSA